MSKFDVNFGKFNYLCCYCGDALAGGYAIAFFEGKRMPNNTIHFYPLDGNRIKVPKLDFSITALNLR